MERKQNFDNMIDDLLSGRLPDNKASEVIQQIQQDPTLESEYSFQQDLIEGIKNARKAELKARLSAIPIEPTLIGGVLTYAGLKYAATALLVTSVGLGVYLYSSQEPTLLERETIAFTPSKNLTLDLSSVSKANTPESIQKFDLKSIHKSTNITASANASVVLPENTAEEVISLPMINPPVVSDSFNDELPESPSIDRWEDIGNKKVADAPNTAIENISDSKYSFHYRYYDSKLFLYGDFKGIPYEIIEIHAKNGRTTYLKYENDYYQLQSSTKNIKPLEVITDQELIQEIQLLNKQKVQ